MLLDGTVWSKESVSGFIIIHQLMAFQNSCMCLIYSATNIRLAMIDYVSKVVKNIRIKIEM